MAKELTYEQAMKRLEEIVTILNDGKKPLEESIKLYEESVRLAGFCNEKLENARLKITEIGNE